MKRPILLSMLFTFTLILPSLRPPRAGGGEIVLFDAPRGGWLATLRDDASLQVVEERDGWRRVRLEGWIAGAGAAAGPAGGPAEEAAAEATGSVDGSTGNRAAAPSAASGMSGGAPSPQLSATVSGVLLPTREDQTAGPGAGLVVLLVGDLESLDEEHARAGAECHEALAVSEREIEVRRDDYRKQLNSTDNFREAAKRNDEAKAALKLAERDHRERIDACRRAADEVFQRHAVRRVISDAAGRFEFADVPAGEFRVVAAEIGGESPRAWVLDCPVSGNEPVVLDPRTDGSAMLPYWGLDRGEGSGDQDR